jgi:Rv2632c-like
MTAVRSHIELTFSEHEDRTRANPILDVRGDHFHGFRQARRAPGDPNVPAIGEELAAARALSELSHTLLEAAAERIDRVGA